RAGCTRSGVRQRQSEPARICRHRVRSGSRHVIQPTFAPAPGVVRWVGAHGPRRAGRPRGGGWDDGGMSRASLAKDPRDVAGMFDGVEAGYDRTNDVLTMGIDRLWRRATVAAVAARPGMRVLDLAAGTGTSSEVYADAGIDVVPCDFSAGMVAVGKRRRPDLPFVVGDATALPFADDSFDVVTISFGLRNVVD